MEIIKGCKANDRMMQEIVYRRHYAGYLKLCMRYASCDDDARQLLNDAFFKIFSRIEQYSADAPFPAWMHRIVINTCLDHVKQRMRRAKNETVVDSDALAPVASADYEDMIGRMNFQEIIKRIQELPDKHRAVFNMSVFEGMSHREIAGELNISYGTSQWYLSKAKEMLRAKLSSEKRRQRERK